MSIGGVLVSGVRLALAVRDGADLAARARLRTPGGAPSTGARVALGREVAQGVVLLGSGRSAHRLGGVVDALHAASMVLYGVVRPGRGGFAEAARAAAFAMAEWTIP